MFCTIDKELKKHYKVSEMPAEIFVAINNKAYEVKERVGTPAELGKRFICARELVNKTVGKDGVVVTDVIYKPGNMELPDGTVINAGCGTEFLVTKASPNIIECCGKPAVLQKPKPLPSSD